MMQKGASLGRIGELQQQKKRNSKTDTVNGGRVLHPDTDCRLLPHDDLTLQLLLRFDQR